MLTQKRTLNLTNEPNESNESILTKTKPGKRFTFSNNNIKKSKGEVILGLSINNTLKEIEARMNRFNPLTKNLQRRPKKKAKTSRFCVIS